VHQNVCKLGANLSPSRLADHRAVDRACDRTWHLPLCLFLVLPDMRDSLDWSYASAGFMNTINAAGYLAGALTANIVIRRIGLFNTLIVSAAACVLSLVMSALTGDFIVFSAARLLSGIAAAFAFIAGGALAAHVAEAQATRKAFYLSLFYIGPAAGILLSGFVAPVLLKEFGPGNWWIVWPRSRAFPARWRSCCLSRECQSRSCRPELEAMTESAAAA
jgi:MFS family permease